MDEVRYQYPTEHACLFGDTLISVGKEVSLCEAYFTEFTATHPAYARMRRSTRR